MRIAALTLLFAGLASAQATQQSPREQARKDYQQICERAKQSKVAELTAKCEELRKQIRKEKDAGQRKRLREELKEAENELKTTQANPPPPVTIYPAKVGDVGQFDGFFTVVQLQPDGTALATYSYYLEVITGHTPSGFPIRDTELRVRKETYLLRGFDLSDVGDGAKYTPRAVGFVSGRHGYTNTQGAQVTALVVEPL